MAGELELKKESFIENTREYFGDIRSEMKRVTWPNKDQVRSTTLVVIFTVFAFAAFFKIVDFLIELSVTRIYAYLVK